MPFEIPESWEWVRLGSISSVLGGKRIPAGRKLTSENTGHIYIRVSDMKNNSVLTDNLLYVPDDIYPSISKYIIESDDVYITVAGTIGTVGKIPPLLNGANLTENADRIVFRGFSQDWLIQCMQSDLVQGQIAAATTKVGQPKLAIIRIENLLIPLPPLTEQHRIVSKIEELLPLINEYEKAENQLTTLNAAFPDQLKKSILQQAIQGKLVPQDPNDEPASVLLERIRAEKQELIKAGKIKKDKNESVIFKRDNSHYELCGGVERCIDEEIPFEVPETWAWCRLGNIISIEAGKGLTSKQMKDGDIPVYGGNGITGYHNESMIHEETIVIGRVGYYCGSVHVTEKEAWVTDNAFITTYPQNSIFRDYLVYALMQMNLGKSNNATAQPVVSGKKIYPLLFPLPPLLEQYRIVAKIKQLLPIIDKI